MLRLGDVPTPSARALGGDTMRLAPFAERGEQGKLLIHTQIEAIAEGDEAQGGNIDLHAHRFGADPSLLPIETSRNRRKLREDEAIETEESLKLGKAAWC